MPNGSGSGESSREEGTLSITHITCLMRITVYWKLKHDIIIITYQLKLDYLLFHFLARLARHIPIFFKHSSSCAECPF